MRSSFVGGIVLALWSAASPAYGSCGLTWEVPSNYFDGVNERGMVSYWEKVDAVDLGEGLKLPLIVNFRSDRNSSSNYLGSGWMLALMESCLYQVDERNFVMIQPDGLNRYFFRVNPKDTILKDRGGWAAEIQGDTITAWAQCGWKLVFKNGRLASLQTPESRKLEFVHAGDKAVALREGGKVHIASVADPVTGLIKELHFNNRRLDIELRERPIVASINGQNLVSSMAPALYRIAGRAKGDKEYNFGVNDKIQPNLSISGSPERVLTWDPATKLIVSDSQWSYTIVPGAGSFANASIQRKNPQGATESWHHDRAKGVETEWSLDGGKKVTSYFSKGLLAGKLRRIEETVDGTTKVISERSYNEKGQLARERDSDGTVTAFVYDDAGRLTGIDREDQPFARRTYDAQNRISTEEVLGAHKVTFHYLPAGGFEKTTTKIGGETETLVFDAAEKLVAGVFGENGQKVSFGEHLAMPIPDTSEKRDAIVRELTEKLARADNPIARGDLIIHIGAVYTDESLGESDPRSAIKVFESILADPLMDDYTKAQAHSWITSKYIEIGRDAWPQGISHIEQLLALEGQGLPPGRLNGLLAEKKDGFRKLLALVETGHPKKDQGLWQNLLKKYGNLDAYKMQLDDRLAAQRETLAAKYFNN